MGIGGSKQENAQSGNGDSIVYRNNKYVSEKYHQQEISKLKNMANNRIVFLQTKLGEEVDSKDQLIIGGSIFAAVSVSLIAMVVLKQRSSEQQARAVIKKLTDDMQRVKHISKSDINNAKKFGIKSFANDLLIPYDNLKLAIESQEKIKNSDNLAEGVRMTHDNLLKIFNDHNIIKIDPAHSETFDPNLHEACSTVDTGNKELNNTVQSLLQPGFQLNLQILRPARVAVYKYNPEAPVTSIDAASSTSSNS